MPPAKSETVRVAAARAGAAKRWNPDDPAAAMELATARIEDYIQRVVADAPPLTDAQKSRLTALLRVVEK